MSGAFLAMAIAMVGSDPTSLRQPTDEAFVAPLQPTDLERLDPELVKLIETVTNELKAKTKDPSRWMRLALVYEANGLSEMAIPCLEHSLALDEAQPRCWFHLALTYATLEQMDQAIVAMRRVQQLDGAFAPARWRLGYWLMEKGELDEAAVEFAASIQADPQDVMGRIGMARLNLIGDEPEKAAALLEGAPSAQAGPNQGYARHLLATAYRRMGRVESDATIANPESNVEPIYVDRWQADVLPYCVTYQGRLQMADNLAAAGALDAAIDIYQSLRSRRSDDAQLLNKLGVALGRRGRFDQSMSALQQAIHVDPGNASAFFNLAMSLAMGSRQRPPPEASELLQRALDHAQRSVELDPSNAKAHGLCGDLLVIRGNLEQAIAAWQRAARIDSRSPQWSYQIGKAMLQLERWDEAASALGELTRRFPNHAEALALLGVAQMKLGRLNQAEQTLRHAAQLRPNDRSIADVLRQTEQLQADAAHPSPRERESNSP